MGAPEPYPEPYMAAVRRGFQLAAEAGRKCSPVYLLGGVAGGTGLAAAALGAGTGQPLPAAVAAAGELFGDDGSYLHGPAQLGAAALARQLGQPPEPGHLLIVLIDQGTPGVRHALSLAGLDPAGLRAGAVAAVGAPAGLPAVQVPVPAAGSMGRPALPVAELDQRAWGALRWRQDRLPLRSLRRRGDWEALRNLEYRAAARVARRLGLDDDQQFSLLHRHGKEVRQRAMAARPDLLRPLREHAARRRLSGRRLPRRVRVLAGWAAWFGNRRAGLRDRWFRLRTLGAYRNAPQR
ncbi:MAG TPA: hypothetical protein VHV09_25960 [Trebonia sp.]|jgi:hypothetical protein|nr:hypothetical protein [Trebonia sp.]